ncbi:RNA polymerase sigma factor [Planktothrix sp. PCC 11201]|uniref:RNA polymerase sigma factor n=1 Tax=Planktothrix sp. PCC 11201 TaxID=1729650 RepID=UPI0009A75820|nr:RNA polymerase sigma factor [Planktothrix sp. PCC 11201]
MQFNCPESNLLLFVPDSAYPNSFRSFWQLWQKYQNYLYRRCLYWMGNPIDAEDALSQAMLKAWEKTQTGKGALKNIKAWLTRLTHNVCMDIHRRFNRGGKPVESLDEMDVEWENQVVAQEENPLLAATQQEVENFFFGAIQELPPRLRETFILHVQEELSYSEIAEKLNISNPNVRKRISQARSILRKQFNEYSGEDNQPHDPLKVSSKSSKSNDFKPREAITNDHSRMISAIG